MKKAILALLLALAALAQAFSQELRTNYILKGITHTASQPGEFMLGEMPCTLKLEKVRFGDGGILYQIHIGLGKKDIRAPKGVKAAFNLSGGALVRADQLEKGGEGKLRYALDETQLKKLLGGVTGLDIITGWDPEDYLQGSFPGNEFSILLKEQMERIDKAPKAVNIDGVELSSYSETLSSTIISSAPITVRGQAYAYNLLLECLCYKSGSTEDFDLKFAIGSSRSMGFPVDTPVLFTLSDGSSLSLPNTRADENFIYLCPTRGELFRLMGGIKAIRISYGEGILEDTFPGDYFSEALSREYQLLMSVSPR